MKFLRILPEIWARTSWPLGKATRNMVPGKTWVTEPVNSIGSSLGTERGCHEIAICCHAQRSCHQWAGKSSRVWRSKSSNYYRKRHWTIHRRNRYRARTFMKNSRIITVLVMAACVLGFVVLGLAVGYEMHYRQ